MIASRAIAMALLREVETGSQEENAPKQESKARF
jgi:hypothetical protein